MSDRDNARADELVNLVGDLQRMAQTAMDSRELVLAHHLTSAAAAALMRLAALDSEVAGSWEQIYLCNLSDRCLARDELLHLAAAGTLSRYLSATIIMAAEMLPPGY